MGGYGPDISKVAYCDCTCESEYRHEGYTFQTLLRKSQDDGIPDVRAASRNINACNNGSKCEEW